MTIGKTLRKLRNDKGLSLSELSKLSGVSKKYISEIENEIKKNIGSEIIQKLSAVFGVTSDYLLGASEEEGLIYVAGEKLPKPLSEYYQGLVILEEAYKKGFTDEQIKELIDFAIKVRDRK